MPLCLATLKPFPLPLDPHFWGDEGLPDEGNGEHE
jgi:hypothetical protein